MTIHVICPNGHKLKAKDSHAGRSLPCPACGAIVVAPTPETDVSADLEPLRDLNLESPLAERGPRIAIVAWGAGVGFFVVALVGVAVLFLRPSLDDGDQQIAQHSTPNTPTPTVHRTGERNKRKATDRRI